MSGSMTRREAIDLFGDALRAAGLAPDKIEADGALHRFSTNGKGGDDSGWYVVHTDGLPTGAFGCWRQSISQTWSAPVPPNMTAPARELHKRTNAEIKRQRDAERERGHAEARMIRARDIWERATPESGDHRYLRRKDVSAHGIRTDGQRLVIPMRDKAGILHSIQYIDPAANKRYLPGGRVSGCYHAIGRPDALYL